MKYFLDTEFLEGTQKKWFGQTKPTIDLISIGIVCEDGREYYAVVDPIDINLHLADNWVWDNVIKYLLVIIIFIIFIIIGGISYFIISNYENDKSPSEQVDQKIPTQDDIKKSVQQRQ